jgi:hypothetical protein
MGCVELEKLADEEEELSAAFCSVCISPEVKNGKTKGKRLPFPFRRLR